MKKKLFAIILMVCLCLQLLAIGGFAAGPDAPGDSSVERPSATIDGSVYDGKLSTGADYFAYIPACADYGGRPTVSPILIVFGNAPYTASSAKEAALSSGLAEIADVEHAPIIFVNPIDGKAWTEADKASYTAVHDLFTDSSYGDYSDKGTSLANQDRGIAAGLYPGSYTRMFVFAEGAGADFAYEQLATGVEAKGQFFGTGCWKPVSLFLMNPGSDKTVDINANAAREVPVCIVNGSSAVAESFKAVNAAANTLTVSSNVTAGFDKTALLSAYNDLLEHWFIRDMGGTMTLLPIPKNSDLGITETRVDYAFGDKTMTTYQYIPNSAVGKVGTVPLVLAFHGSGSTAECMVWSAGWLQLAAKDGFAILAVDYHNDFSDNQIMEAVQSFVDKNAFVDKSRIYSSGFSMGSMKTFSLTGSYPDFFAGAINMNGFSGLPATANGTIMPIFAMGGAQSHIRTFEFPSADNTATLEYYFEANGVTSNLQYNSNYTWGRKADKVTEVVSDSLPDLTVTVSEFAAKDGNTYTAFASLSVAGHEPTFTSTAEAWKFISRFSRNSDGSIAISGAGAHTAESAGVFRDVEAGDWYLPAVKYAKENNLISGKGLGIFDPGGAVTRADFTTLLYRLEGTPAVSGASSFQDVPVGQYYSDAVLWAEQNGLASGQGGGIFNPSGIITREQMATLLYRYAEYKGYSMDLGGADLGGFSDAGDISEYAVSAMTWSVAKGLISGKSAGILDPGGATNRAEVAQLLMNYRELLAK